MESYNLGLEMRIWRPLKTVERTMLILSGTRDSYMVLNHLSRVESIF